MRLNGQCLIVDATIVKIIVQQTLFTEFCFMPLSILHIFMAFTLTHVISAV